MIGSIIGALIVGVIVGVLGRLIAPGRQNIPFWLTVLVGIVAAFLGTLVARAFGVEDTAGIDWWELLFQIVIAAVGVTLAAAVYPRARSSA